LTLRINTEMIPLAHAFTVLFGGKQNQSVL